MKKMTCKNLNIVEVEIDFDLADDFSETGVERTDSPSNEIYQILDAIDCDYDSKNALYLVDCEPNEIWATELPEWAEIESVKLPQELIADGEKFLKFGDGAHGCCKIYPIKNGNTILW